MSDFNSGTWNDYPRNKNEFQFLRKCVRYELTLRKGKPRGSDHFLSSNRSIELQNLAKTLTQERGG